MPENFVVTGTKFSSSLPPFPPLFCHSATSLSVVREFTYELCYAHRAFFSDERLKQWNAPW
jgi:hypothetical protein